MPFSPHKLLQQAPPALATRRFCIGYSGGLDSTALLHALAIAAPGRVRALHVHHGLQAAADGWAEGCRRFCNSLGIGYTLARVQIAADDPRGPEAAARAARYAAFEQALQPDEVLVTAHHRDDQAETFLLRALRGSGPLGLAAIAPLQTFGRGQLWRPLLATGRDELLAYARQHDLTWIDDPHNADPRYARSALRTQVMAPLRQLWPGAADSLARSAQLCAEGAGLLDELAATDLAAVTLQGGQGEALSVAALLSLSLARRNNALRPWIAARAAPVTYAVLERIETELLRAREDAEPLLTWPGGELRRYRDGLYAMPPLPPEPQGFEAPWDGAVPLALPDGSTLQSPAPFPEPVTVRYPQGGERFRPDGAAHSRSLKNVFQEAGIPPWQRRRTPLLFVQGELRWIAALPGASVPWRDIRWLPRALA